MGLPLEYGFSHELHYPKEAVDYRGEPHRLHPDPELSPIPLFADVVEANVHFHNCHYSGPMLSSLFSPLNLAQPMSTASPHKLLPEAAQTRISDDGATTMLPFAHEAATGSAVFGTRLIPQMLAFSLSKEPKSILGHNGISQAAALIPEGYLGLWADTNAYSGQHGLVVGQEVAKYDVVSLSPALEADPTHSLVHVKVDTAVKIDPAARLLLTGSLHLLAVEPKPIAYFRMSEFVGQVQQALLAINKVLGASMGFESELCPAVPQRGYLSMGHHGN
jgi:hypothetical protein